MVTHAEHKTKEGSIQSFAYNSLEAPHFHLSCFNCNIDHVQIVTLLLTYVMIEARL